MAYASIAKLDKFTGKEDDTQDTANAWYQSLAIKPQNFNEFKTEFLRYFSNNNSINKLANTFTTIKQEKTEAVTIYLGWFYKNLCQIQVIQADYFTAPQILNQFICRLYSSILQHNTVTNAQDFEAAELEANHAQAINLVMNELSELDSKLKQFTDISNTNDTTIILTSSLSASSSNLSTAVPTQLSAAVSGKLSTPTISNTAIKLTSKQNSKTNINTAKLEIINGSLLTDLQFYNTTIRILTMEFGHWICPKPEFPELFKSPETNQKQSLTNNIPLATITNNESLAVIFSFKLEETTPVPLFSGTTLDTKPITTMYTNAKINGHFIKLILDSRSAGSIITKQLMDQLGHQVDCAASARIITADEATKTLIGKIDDFLIEVNGIIIPIKVLIIEATQYQALINNDWLSKTNALFDWNMQELQISQNRQHTCVPAMCDHFTTTNLTAPLIEFEEEKEKPIWEAYQVSLASEEHNKLLSVPLWNDNNRKEKKKEEFT
ncbi:hypothetical protein G9A89_019922 [Geosiphon pyriformis]|nr:hypothetical protein G9A89_019922 [Geosiphon pyriformis]